MVVIIIRIIIFYIEALNSTTSQLLILHELKVLYFSTMRCLPRKFPKVKKKRVKKRIGNDSFSFCAAITFKIQICAIDLKIWILILIIGIPIIWLSHLSAVIQSHSQLLDHHLHHMKNLYLCPNVWSGVLDVAPQNGLIAPLLILLHSDHIQQR